MLQQRKFVLITLLLVILAFAARWASTTAQKPVRESSNIVDATPPPNTAADLAAESDAAVLAQYTGKRRVDDSGRGPMQTFYTFRILEILKPHAYLANEEFEISMLGGEREYDTHTELQRVEGVRQLVPKRTYVVFLKVTSAGDRLDLPYRNASLYDVTSGRVESINEARRDDDGKERARFLDELRGVIGRP